MTMTTDLIAVPLNKLAVSGMNVRKTAADEIADLLSSIPVHGLIENLTVVETDKKGFYEVVAGGRRMRALHQLAIENIIVKDYSVPCRVVQIENAEAISLAENIIRAPMHAADQFDAFRQQVEAGKTISDVSAAYGVSETVVRKRLKLANVAPEILAAFREKQVSLNAVMAFTLTDDHERQRAVFIALPHGNSHSIKRALTEGKVGVNDKRVRYIGLEAYEAAGGYLVHDLFEESSNNAYLCNVDLLDKLFAEKLETAMAEVKAEGWQDVILGEGYYEVTNAYRGRVYPEVQYLEPEQEADRISLTEELDALAAQVEADPDNDELAEEYQRLSDRINAMRVEIFTPEAMANAIAVFLFDYNGELTIYRGLTKTNRKAAQDDAKKEDQTDEDGLPAASAALKLELAATRTAMIAADLCNNPNIALAATVHALAIKALGHYGSYSALQIQMTPAAMAEKISNQEIKPLAVLGSKLDAIRADAPANPAQLWTHFLSMDQEELLECLAVFAALSLNGTQIYGEDQALTHGDQLADKLATHPENWASLSDLPYLERSRINTILELVEKERGKQVAAALTNLKKKDLDEAALNRLDGSWLPSNLYRFVADPSKSEPLAYMDRIKFSRGEAAE